MAFDSPNRKLTCDKVVMSPLNSSNWTNNALIEGENGMCMNQPEQLITFPGNITGGIKLSWICSGDKQDPCRILTIKSETRPGAASTATAFAVRQTCPTSLPTETSSDASAPTINQSAAPSQSTGDPVIDISQTQAGSTAATNTGSSVPTIASSEAGGYSDAPMPSKDSTTGVPSASMSSIAMASSSFTTSISRPTSTPQPAATNDGITSKASSAAPEPSSQATAVDNDMTSNTNGAASVPTTQASLPDAAEKPASSAVDSSGKPCTCAG